MHDRLESAPLLVSIYIFIFCQKWGGDSSSQERKNPVPEFTTLESSGVISISDWMSASPAITQIFQGSKTEYMHMYT